MEEKRVQAEEKAAESLFRLVRELQGSLRSKEEEASAQGQQWKAERKQLLEEGRQQEDAVDAMARASEALTEALSRAEGNAILQSRGSIPGADTIMGALAGAPVDRASDKIERGSPASVSLSPRAAAVAGLGALAGVSGVSASLSVSHASAPSPQSPLQSDLHRRVLSYSSWGMRTVPVFAPLRFPPRGLPPSIPAPALYQHLYQQTLYSGIHSDSIPGFGFQSTASKSRLL